VTRLVYYRWQTLKFGCDAAEEAMRVKNGEDPMGVWEREAIIDAQLAGHFGRLALGQTELTDKAGQLDHFPICDVGCDIPGGGAA